ncbi:MAG: glycosyltransferase family 39 protein [Candidatus Omnitrophica bacterium]|nr:glycosyltransferase family 39 protein [Candidatus Omnitrophota bacterium]
MKKISIFIIIGIFLILSLPNIYNPGISIDEADEAIACDFMFKNDSIIRHSVSAGYYIALFNKIIPIMHGPYTGRIHVYLMYIFSRLFGVNVFSLRLTSIIVSAITVCFIYLLCRMWFGCRVAIVTALLTATNLYFVQYARVGHYREAVFVICFFWAGFFLLAKYLQERKFPFLYLGLFLFGVGLSTKITMVFYLVGLGITLVILRKGFRPFFGMTLNRLGLGLTCFFLGSFNIILFNILYGGKSFEFLLKSLRYSAPSGYNNLAYLNNLRQRVQHLIVLLNSNLAEKIDWGVTQNCFIEHIAPMLVIFFFTTLIFVFLRTFFSKNILIKYRILFFFVLYTIVFLFTPFTTLGSHPGHLLVFLPFPQIVMALFLDCIWMKLKNKKIAFGMLSLFLLPILVFHIWMNIHFHKEMIRNGGYRRWSATIYELSNYLKEEKIHSPVTFGWGLGHNIIFLSKYSVIPNQLDENYSLEYVNEEYHRLSSARESIFFLTKNSKDYMPNLNLFMSLAKRDGMNKKLYKVFYNRAGEPVYWLYKIY